MDKQQSLKKTLLNNFLIISILQFVVAPTLDQDIVGFDMSFQDFYLERASYDETYWSKVFISSESSDPTLAYVIKGQGNYSIVAYYSLFELQKVINNLELDNQGI
ncbi:MAG: hypothetical protein PF505_01350, partial [Vallitaleaceae bacterium]|nr:hypothetical protein [Vallitaleaceae bacterium]